LGENLLFFISTIIKLNAFGVYLNHVLVLGELTTTLYALTDTITADFNGDGFIDKVIYKKEKETSGIIIIHGKTNEQVKIGFGKQFAHMTEFNWIDYWGLVEDKETSETTFTEDGDVLDSKTVNLKNPSIALGKDEVGGGLITYLNGKYVWIHQTC
jgi:hypothetical protein